ncbi:curli-like amyloid fiber formation chaperone CsgH [Rhizobium paknamense]|uniref:CsgH-like domain-containing protein n=1 Tax=Rhizobium paknamense TaxID=1206817 RepID=A0ABU0IAD9_9HYPH|nr:curli-like amyloid fiber formation chaperone CsgH [Rhizobium paknamense]MDQ0455190.1 hypothetical protein [Rhizobium paknamense]
MHLLRTLSVFAKNRLPLLPDMRPRHLLAAGLALVIPASAIAGAIITDRGGTSGPLRCEIRATPQGGGIAIEARARADLPTSGTYALKVEGSGAGSGSGSTRINQGGAFIVTPGIPARLGSVTLAANGARYDISLDLSTDGGTVRCQRTVGDDG